MKTALALAVTVALVALIRSSFHLAWVMLVTAVLFGIMRRHKLRLLIFVPCAFVIAWYAKNWIVYGTFSASSWAGMNLYQIASRNGGDTVKVADVFPLVTETAHTVRPELAGIPSVSAAYKSNGDVNYGHYAYIEIGQRRMGQALGIIRTCPECYRNSVVQASALLLRSPSDYLSYTSNYRILNWWSDLWDNYIYGKALTGGHLFYPGLLIFVPMCAMCGLWLTLRREPGLWFALVTVLYALVVYSTLDLGENMRFRVEIDPILFVFGVTVFARVLKAIKSARRGTLGGAVGP